MSTLADRYVWGVLRAVPERQRADLEPEIRALIADAIDARAGNPSLERGQVDASDAERAALSELGDPEILAARYSDRSLYLIGPSYFLDYRRLLGLLLWIVVPIVTLATLAGGFIAGIGAAEVALNAVNAGLMVGIQLAFWVTLVFALVERNGSRKAGSLLAWTPDRLPFVPSPSRLSAGEAAISVATSVFLIAVIVWQPPFISGDRTVPMLDPALWSSWFPWFIAVAALEIAFNVVLFTARRWTWAFAAINAVLGAAFAIPAAWLLQTGQLLSQDAVAEMERIGAGAALAPTMAVMTVVIIGLVAWDALDGFLKAGRRSGNNRAISGEVSRT